MLHVSNRASPVADPWVLLEPSRERVGLQVHLSWTPRPRRGEGFALAVGGRSPSGVRGRSSSTIRGRAPRPQRRATSVILLAICLLGALVAAPAALAQNDPASWALRYLAVHQAADGSLDASVGETEDFVLGLAAAGYDPDAQRSAANHSPLDFLAAHVSAATADAGKASKLIVALVASGRDPRAFAGHDLLTTLDATYDPATGRYGGGATFTQSLAILALVGAAVPAFPVPTAATDALRAAQDSDGSWNYLGTKDASAGGDTNSTAIAIQALVASGSAPTAPALSSALAYLHLQQQPDAGFPYQAGVGTTSDPDSDALVIEALRSVGQDPSSSSWTKGPATPWSNLLGFQDTASGGFRYPGNLAPDAFTTSQVPQGLLAQPLPFGDTFAMGRNLASDGTRATAALRYLRGLQHADGSLDGSPGETEDFVLGAAAAGYDPSTLTTCSGGSAYGYLSANVSGATADAGKTAKLILAVAVGRRSAQSFAGTDLIGRLNSFYDPTNGAYGGGATFSQSLAMLALGAVGQPVPAAAIAELKGLQRTDGSWNYLAQPDAGAGDTNSTAVALMALAAVGDTGPAATALTYLHGQQQSDGGFPYQTGPGALSDPDSDALVSAAMTALHISPAAPAWTVAGHTVLDNLATFQASNGGFTYPGSAGPDAFTTSQVPSGLERMPLPGFTDWPAGRALPKLSCAGAGGTGVTLTPPPTSTLGAGVPPTEGPTWPLELALIVLAGVVAVVTGARRRWARPR